MFTTSNSAYICTDNRFALGIGNDPLYSDSFLLCPGYVFDAFTSFGQGRLSSIRNLLFAGVRHTFRV